MTLCGAHKNKLLLHYAIDPERPEVRALVEGGQLRTVTSQEIEDLSGWRVDGQSLHWIPWKRGLCDQARYSSP